MRKKMKAFLGVVACILMVGTIGCKKKQSNANTAFYYWKTTFELDAQQTGLLKNAAHNRLYLRFFDVVWDPQKKEVLPNAIINIKQNTQHFNITPVVYITNKTFETITANQVDSLAKKVNGLINSIATTNKIAYTSVQIDCDWTIGTRSQYFAFLKILKQISKKQLEATIRLHQVKYADRTGVPPVDKGLLMFYNMGKISAQLDQANSIYNTADAEKYVAYLTHYKLPLDIALPLFSWSIHIRDGKVIQIYAKIGRKELSDKAYFEPTQHANVYRAVKGFFLAGIYIKEDDLFKLEEMDQNQLDKAAEQAAKYLAHLEKRNIIYYELSTIGASTLEAESIQEVSSHF